jgi:hypothetical protein
MALEIITARTMAGLASNAFLMGIVRTKPFLGNAIGCRMAFQTLAIH